MRHMVVGGEKLPYPEGPIEDIVVAGGKRLFLSYTHYAGVTMPLGGQL